jgi:hypothetical protein
MAPFPIWTKQLSRPFGGMSPHIRAGCGVDAFAAALSAQLLTALMLQVMWCAFRIRWYSSDVN